MARREFHYRWEYDLRASPEDLWPYIADTNRFNRDTGLPSVERASTGVRLANARRRLRLCKFGMPLEWEEQPFEWIRPRRFGVVRRYNSGPIEELRVLVELAPRAAGGTRLTYQVWAHPKNLLGQITIPLQLGLLSARSFAAAFQRYDKLAASGRPPLYQPAKANFAPGGRERLHALSEKLLARGAQRGIVKALVEMIEQADDLTLMRLRSHVLADYWGVSRRELLELCLWATRLGLLDLQWDILCPLCRGAKQSSASLKEVVSRMHCETCNIDFTANFDRSVELTFRPNPSIRKIEGLEFCVGGPQVTPHVVTQQLLQPGAERTVQLALEPGRYRLRTLELPGGQYFQVTADGAKEVVFEAHTRGWRDAELDLSTQPALRFVNATRAEQLFIIERINWSDQATTAAEVTALQVFRDLFATEALRPGEMISVGTLTVLFTDLKGSTQLYRDIGDATAFGLVMNHFDVLRDAIAAEDGALVKTIGDAVMGVFRHPAAALRAMLQAQEMLARPPAGVQPLVLKAGLHVGPCIAVTLNERLDYFGSTVNMAARLEGLSTGDDVIISSVVHDDPEVQAILMDRESALVAAPFAAPLKGFTEERFKLWRVAKKGMRRLSD